jgi:hypothetical protein
MQNSVLGVTDGALKTTRAIIFLRVVYKLEKADLLRVEVAAAAGAGNVAKSSVDCILILLQEDAELMVATIITPNAVALSLVSIRITTAVVGITATVSADGNYPRSRSL